MSMAEVTPVGAEFPQMKRQKSAFSAGLENIKKLFKVKAKTSRDGFLWFVVAAAFLLITGLATTIFGIFKWEEVPGHVYSHNIMDYSVVYFWGIVFGYLIVAFLYRYINDRLAVFPQTGSSRYISTLLSYYAYITCINIVILVMHLITYGTYSLISVFKENLYLLPGLDITLLSAGFLTHLLYSFLVMAVVEFIGSIIRKWTYVSVAIITAAVSFLLTSNGIVFYYLQKGLAFFTEETSFGSFLIKAAGVWIIFTALSIVINRFTVYHKSRDRSISKRVAILCIICGTMILVFVPTLWIFRTEETVNIIDTDTTEPTPEEFAMWEADEAAYYERRLEFQIDVSHLPRGSEINVLTNREDILVYDDRYLRIGDARLETLFNDDWIDPLSDLQGDTLIVYIDPPYLDYDLYRTNILQYTNPKFNVYLEGNTLHLEHIADSAQVVFLQVWGLADQFEFTPEKGRAFREFGSGSGVWGGGVNAYIGVE